MMRIKNCILTGSDGYIGSHLKPYLENKQIKVIPYMGDINKFYISETPDMIIHLAALTGVRKSIDNPKDYHRVNVLGTRKIFKYDVPILFASSSNAKEVTNPYAQTKLTNEEERPKNSVGFRPHTVYPGRPDMLYQRLVKKEVKYINAKHYRDFTHIDDLCSAIHTIIENYNTFMGKVIDIGSGESVSVLEVAKSMGFDGEVRYENTPSERETTCADISPLLEVGWKSEKRILL
jgi:UDP-glucuronate 4-epimerase